MVKKKIVEKTVTLDIKTGVKYPDRFPWDFAPNSIDEINCLGVFEYIPGKLRGKFMDEVYRILKPEGKATFFIPYWNNATAYMDYRFEWPPISEQSFLYFIKSWRDSQKLDLGLKCDFEFSYGYSFDQEMSSKNDETKAFNVKHYINSVQALQIQLTKVKR